MVMEVGTKRVVRQLTNHDKGIKNEFQIHEGYKHIKGCSQDKVLMLQSIS